MSSATPGAKFTQGSTMRHVVVMTLTSSLGLLALFFVDAINLFYISLLGVTELAAAIGYAGTIQFFMISVSIGLLIAGSATVSRAIGAGDADRARQLAGSALITSFLSLCVLAAIVWTYRIEALMLLGARGEALEKGGRFLAIALPSVPLIGIGMTCSGVLRAIGEARRAMYVTLGGGAVAAVLDPIFIFGFGLELTGAAIAIVLTRASIAALGLWLVIARHDMLARPNLPHWLEDLPLLAAIAGPAMATQLSTPFGMAYLTRTVAEYGDSAVAGWAVIGRMAAVCFGGIFALAGAVGPIIGQNYGAKLYPRIKSTYLDALKFIVVYVLVAWGAVWLATEHIIAGFGLSDAGAEILREFTTCGAGAYIFTGALFVSNAAFNNLGRPFWSTFFNWSRDAAAIPLMAFLFAGSLGVSAAVDIQAMAGLIVGTVAAIVGWRTVRVIAVTDAPPVPAPIAVIASGRAAETAHPPLVSGPENR